MQILPIKELQNTSKISELCAQSSEPVFITKNGYGKMVIMNIEVYEALQEEKLLLERLAQIDNESELPFNDFLSDLKRKYGNA